MAGPHRHLVIFLKAPRLGAVKRRLAADIGRYRAWRFYRAESARLLRTVAGDRRWRTWLAVTPDRFADRGRFWPRHLARLPQGPGDLGRRMARPFQTLPPGPVVLIGSDIPGVSRDHIARAFAAVERADILFGPARDGGFWLIGLSRRRLRKPGFAGVAWSTDRTLAQALAAVAPHRKIALGDVMQDVDDGAGWRRWRATLAGGEPPVN